MTLLFGLTAYARGGFLGGAGALIKEYSVYHRVGFRVKDLGLAPNRLITEYILSHEELHMLV